jgi:outer membrane protein insertion porin family
MFKRFSLPLVALFVASATGSAAAQTSAQAAGAAPAGAPLTVCGVQVPPPSTLPPAGSGPVLWQLAPCWEAQGNVTQVDQQTYLYYIQLKDKVSHPSDNVWQPYNEETEKFILEDFRRLWALGFLDNLWVEKRDYTFSNGVVGEIVVYNMEERQRVKIVDYVGSKKLEMSKIDDKLKELNSQVKLDTFIDPALVRKVSGVVRDMLREKGFQDATVTPEIQPMEGGPKLVHLTFHMSEGPIVKIRSIEFVGNKDISDGTLRGKMKENKAHGMFSWLTGHGNYQEGKFEEDAERVMAFYRDRGYIAARVGEPQLKDLGRSSDGKTRWVEVRVPVEEGKRYRVGDISFDGNTVVKTEALKPLFKLEAGEFYSEKKIRDGFNKAKEVYGAGGYWEFTGYPDLKPRDLPDAQKPSTDGTDGSTDGRGPEATAPPAPKTSEAPKPEGPPIVDITVRLQEGKQYFVNRITFVGNTTTRDNVIRREMRLYENGVFNTEALKFSIRRLNQLGYFKPLEEGGKGIDVEKTAGAENKVDLKLKLEEQNRNQLTFGAGVSQFEGFFGQMSFQTSNFLGRGESLTVSLQSGSRAQNYSLAFTEPFLFDRNITGGANVFHSEIRYISAYTQLTSGGVLTFGFPIGRGFTRMFTNYSYERVRVTDIAAAYTDPIVLQRNPFLADSLLLGQNGERIISKVTPSLVYNTVDQPIFPTTGKRLTASIDLAVLGGNTKFYEPTLEAVWYLKQNSRMTLGMRGQVQYIGPLEGTTLPIFQKLFLGGEYSVRGFDIRSIGPSDPFTGVVLGGNKSLLFNVEEAFTIAGPVRLILFYDAGQVRAQGQPFSFSQNVVKMLAVPPPLLSDPFAAVSLTDPTFVPPSLVVKESAFKTSTGAEVRFFMPVLNVPFRLIFAYNPQRAGVLNNSLQPQAGFAFRFAVGTTF